LDAQDAENEFSLPFVTLEHRFIRVTKVVFKATGRQIMSTRVIRLLEILLPRIRPNSFFLDAQEVENELAWPFNTLKHRFIDTNKVAF
jgi:hypothetical protein